MLKKKTTHRGFFLKISRFIVFYINIPHFYIYIYVKKNTTHISIFIENFKELLCFI